MSGNAGPPAGKKRSGIDTSLLAFWLPGALMIGLIVLALATIAIPALSNPEGLSAAVTDSEVIHSLLLTFAAGANAVFILFILGTPLAYALARTETRWKGFLESLVDLPLILPHTVAGLMIYLLFMARGPLGAPFADIGIFFEDAYPGIVAAMTFVAIPYYVNAVRSGFDQIPVHLENVARTLGASRLRVFRYVSLPLCTRPILYGCLLAWGRAIGEFAAVIMIAYFPLVISTLIFYRFTTGGLAESTGIAFIMIVLSGLIFLVFRLLTARKGRYDDRA
ncbi:molybdate/tungstate transport system permease protein [Methanolinea mesophila]|uniref:ABC transporter permease n=1 Tax=Methanolinea mesophila TaxID=547055 RepID=UPI001AE7C8C1|nr:ABC transporter permease [Methanolinea mesophila]MBP1928160.1 molybdate/tungstate transport system permease protein [Methanolinea mesophila]